MNETAFEVTLGGDHAGGAKDRVEVELKFRLTPLPSAGGVTIPVVRRKLLEVADVPPGSACGKQRREADTYFRPVGEPDGPRHDVIRLRVETLMGAGPQTKRVDLTYKGASSTPDGGAKARAETVVRLDPDPGNVMAAAAFLAGLGLVPSLLVDKKREAYTVQYEGFVVNAAFDTVDGAGEFVELEIVTLGAAAAGAGRVLRHLADQLGLGVHEPRGYADIVRERAAVRAAAAG